MNGYGGDENARIGSDISLAASENASYSERVARESYPFSARELQATFLMDGRSIGDSLLRMVFDKDTAHLSAMQIEQGLRVLRVQARHSPGDLPDRVKEYAGLPPALLSAMVSGLVSAAKDGNARNEALVAWSGGTLAMNKRRNIGQKIVRPSRGESFA